MIVAHKIALDPTNKQRTLMAKSAGTARFAYNWALGEWQKQYKNGEKPNETNLRKQLNSIKKSEYPWMSEVSKNSPQQAIKNLGSAFNRFFKGLGKYPKFKKKGMDDSFRADNGPPKKGSDAVKVSGKTIKLPVIGKVRMRENLRFSGQIKSVTVSLQAGRWFASISVDVNSVTKPPAKNQGPVGVDLGIKSLATLSTGKTIDSPKPYRRMIKLLKRRQRRLSKKKKGSNNRRKAVLKVQKLHAKIANIRLEALHQLSHSLTRDHQLIGIEDLNVKGMMANEKLARSIADMGFGEFKRQLTYKSEQRGAVLYVADRWFPSSKLCSKCGWKNEDLKLSDRSWVCESCETEHDRDLNAAINLRDIAVSSTVTACGEESSSILSIRNVKLASVKQEPNIKTAYGCHR